MTPYEMLVEAIRVALSETAAASPNYDTDTLAGVIATGIKNASLEVSQAAPPEASDG